MPTTKAQLVFITDEHFCAVFYYIIWNIDLKLLATGPWIKCVFTCCSWRHRSSRIIIGNAKCCNSLKKFAETGWTYSELLVWLIINGSKVDHCKSFLQSLGKFVGILLLLQSTQGSLHWLPCVLHASLPFALMVCMQPCSFITLPWQFK